MADPDQSAPRGGPEPGGESIPAETVSPRLLPYLVLIPLVLLAAGRFLPGSRAWGFNHFAYLPGWVLGAWLVAVLGLGTLLHPGIRRWAGHALADTVPRGLFLTAWGPWLAAAVAGGAFWLLRERSFFMGDGYLVPELVERGVPFRAFDSLDYLLHFQAYQRLGEGGKAFTAFDLYRGSAIAAGMLAVVAWTRLVGKLDWSPWRKTVLLGLLFLAGPGTLFFGYIESYSFLYLFLTAFLIAGLLALERKLPAWVAATFFGLGLASHLTALFTAPALLVLALKGPADSARRRWLEVIVPPAVLFAVAVGLHVAEGFNAFWFRREFIDGQNTKSIWIPLAEGRGLFTAYHWKDLFNLAAITVPACLVVVLASARRLRGLAREPRFLFLLAQVASLAFITLAVDRKLGGARDWDLLTAHSGGLVLLAALLLPGAAGLAGSVPTAVAAPGAPAAKTAPGGPAFKGIPGGPAKGKAAKGLPVDRFADRPAPWVPLVLGVSFLAWIPWVVLLHWEDRSINRFVDVAADFPDFPRGYAYEEVGKYFRKAGNMEQAQRLYEKAVASNPSHARIRVLLGSICFSRENYDAAEEQYQAALKFDPKNYMAMDMLGQVAMKRQRFGTALEWFRREVDVRPNEASGWESFGYAALRAQHWQEAVDGLQKTITLDPTKVNYQHEIGIALVQLGRYDEAIDSFHRVLSRPDARPETRMALAWTRIETARQALEAGQSPPAEWLEEAGSQLDTVLRLRPGDRQATDLREQLLRLRR